MIPIADIPQGKHLLWQFDYDLTHDLIYLDGGKVGKGLVRLQNLYEYRNHEPDYQYNFVCYPFNKQLALVDRCNFDSYNWCKEYGMKWYDTLKQYTNIPYDCYVEDDWKYWESYPCPKSVTITIPETTNPIVITYLYQYNTPFNPFENPREYFSPIRQSHLIFERHHIILKGESSTTLKLEDLALCSVVVNCEDSGVKANIENQLPKGWKYSELDNFLADLKQQIDNTIDYTWLQSYSINQSVSVAHWQREQDTSSIFDDETDGFLMLTDHSDFYSYIAFGIKETRNDTTVDYPLLNNHRACYIHAYPIHNDYLVLQGFDSSHDKWTNELYYCKFENDEKYYPSIGKHDKLSNNEWTVFYGISHQKLREGNPDYIENIMTGATLIKDPLLNYDEPYLPTELSQYPSYPFFRGSIESTEDEAYRPDQLINKQFPKTFGTANVRFFVDMMDFVNTGSAINRSITYRAGVVFFSGSNDSSGEWNYSYYNTDFTHNAFATEAPIVSSLGNWNYTVETFLPIPSHVNIETATQEDIDIQTLVLWQKYQIVDGILYFSRENVTDIESLNIYLSINHYETNMDTMKIKEIHASLNADKYAYYQDSDGNLQSATNSLGWKIEKIAQALGILFDLNGNIQSLRQSKRINQGDTVSEGWYLGQFGVNQGGNTAFNAQNGGLDTEERLGLMYEIKSNQFTKDPSTGEASLGSSGYILVESIPQLLHVILQDLDKSLGLQELGAYVLANPNYYQDSPEKPYFTFEGLGDLIKELAYTVANISKNATQANIGILKTQATANEILSALGLPTIEKTILINTSEGVQQEVNYPALNPASMSLADLHFIELQNLALLNQGTIELNIKE